MDCPEYLDQVQAYKEDKEAKKKFEAQNGIEADYYYSSVRLKNKLRRK